MLCETLAPWSSYSLAPVPCDAATRLSTASDPTRRHDCCFHCQQPPQCTPVQPVIQDQRLDQLLFLVIGRQKLVCPSGCHLVVLFLRLVRQQEDFRGAQTVPCR